MDGSAEGNSLLGRYGIWLTFSCLELPEDLSRFATSCSQLVSCKFWGNRQCITADGIEPGWTTYALPCEGEGEPVVKLRCRLRAAVG